MTGDPGFTRTWDCPRIPPPWSALGTYVDTIAVRLPRRPEDDLDRIPEEARLRELCTSLYVSASSGGRTPPQSSRVLMHQPSREALRQIGRVIDRYSGYMQEVHLTFEVPSSGHFEAEKRRDYLARRLRRRWSRDPWIFRIDDDLGAYYTNSRRWASDRIVLYCDSSKLGQGVHCVRIERRVCGTEQVRRALRGTVYPADLSDMDFHEFWLGSIAFEEPDLVMIGRQARGRARAKKPDSFPLTKGGSRLYDNDEAVGAVLSRQAAIRFDEPWTNGSAQAIRAAYREEPWFRPESCMKPIPFPLVITQPNLCFPPTTAPD